MNTIEFHTPVMVQEVIEGLVVKSGERYIDVTVGGGGHAVEIVRRGGILLGIDQDEDALEFARRKLEVVDPRSIRLGRRSEKLDGGRNWKLVQGNFANIGNIAKKEGFGDVAGILFDLGVSTFQIKKSGRGFSFGQDEPLDMRMNTKSDFTAYQIVNTFNRDELIDVLMRFGEEEQAAVIVQSIMKSRAKSPIATTQQLRRIIIAAVGHKGKIDPATKTFQAIRIAVNSELEMLKKALPQAIELLTIGGRIVVISFHSLEDRIVKQVFEQNAVAIVTKKPLRPSREEILRNPAARSAKMRIAQKIL